MMILQETAQEFRVIGKRAHDRQAPIFRCLAKDQVLRLRRANQVLGVLSGRAWITFDGQDHVLDPDDELPLGRGRDPALVSGLGGRVLSIRLG